MLLSSPATRAVVGAGPAAGSEASMWTAMSSSSATASAADSAPLDLRRRAAAARAQPLLSSLRCLLLADRAAARFGSSLRQRSSSSRGRWCQSTPCGGGVMVLVAGSGMEAWRRSSLGAATTGVGSTSRRRGATARLHLQRRRGTAARAPGGWRRRLRRADRASPSDLEQRRRAHSSARLVAKEHMQLGRRLGGLEKKGPNRRRLGLTGERGAASTVVLHRFKRRRRRSSVVVAAWCSVVKTATGGWGRARAPAPRRR